MTAETAPITDDEWLLRRVRYDGLRTDRHPIVAPRMFEPRDRKAREPDWDGISLYRAACLAAPDDILGPVAPDRRGDFGIVRIPVAILRGLGLDVVSRPDARVPGHVVIPQISTPALEEDKPGTLRLAKALAEIASDPANILVRPAAPLP